MSSMIEVKCPHCNARGIIVTPPKGLILIGPCPVCNGLVVLYDQKVIPLDKKLFKKDISELKINQLIELIIDGIRPHLDEEESEEEERKKPRVKQFSTSRPKVRPSIVNDGAKEITDQEFEDFVKIDLNLIDHPRYFKKFFG